VLRTDDLAAYLTSQNPPTGRAHVVLVRVYQCHPYLDTVVLLMMIDEKKRAVETRSRTHLEMDEIEELLELARKTDEPSAPAKLPIFQESFPLILNTLLFKSKSLSPKPLLATQASSVGMRLPRSLAAVSSG
jgi:hypothetical protein